MRREIPTWFSTLVFLCLLALSACQSTSVVPKSGDHEPQKKQLTDVYDIMIKSSGKGHQRTYGKMHVVHHLKVSQKGKGTYGGASDLNRPKTSHSAASSFRVNHPLHYSQRYSGALLSDGSYLLCFDCLY